ncbi:MAG: tetratricopeptide repeat protein [Marinifilaceae bacterium]|jgi:tetratricopeptide (TPR) repeat protein|nr:tetratricopeptide repeat protein [Marinifilaceae bacterium]
MKNYILLVIAVFFIGNLNAQKLNTYKLVMPEYSLPAGSKIYIDDFKSSSPDKLTKFNESIKAQLKNQLTNDYTANIKNIIPWVSRNLYTIVDNKSEATHIISGRYSYNIGEKQTSQSTKKLYVQKKDGVRTKNADGGEDVKVIPMYAHYYIFKQSQEYGFSGKLELIDMAGKVLLTRDLSKKMNDEKNSTIEKKGEIDSKMNINSLANSIVNNPNITQFLCVGLQKNSIGMKRIKKISDKSAKKAIKSKVKEVKKILRSNPAAAHQAGRIYKSMLELCSTPEILYNIGACYYAIGNYTKAIEYFKKSGNSTGEISKQLAIRNQLISHGLKVVETEI